MAPVTFRTPTVAPGRLQMLPDGNALRETSSYALPEPAMSLLVPQSYPTILIRREAYERSGISRAALDDRLGLTADEFRVAGGLVAIGPIVADTEVAALVADLERLGLVWFEDFFELSGNWPDWLQLHVTSAQS